MPCSGPNPEDSYRRAEKAFKDIMNYLKDSHCLPEKETYGLTKETVEDYNKEVEKFKNALKEMFWLNDCNGF